jgi:hypothetical protein
VPELVGEARQAVEGATGQSAAIPVPG